MLTKEQRDRYNATARRRYSEDREYRAKHMLSQNANRRKKSPEWKMLKKAKNRARKRKMPIDINIQDIQVPVFCPVLGLLLEQGKNERGGGISASPSLDRIDNSKGYVKGNIEVISLRANMIKRDSTPEELFLLAKHYATDETKKMMLDWADELRSNLPVR